MLQRSFIILDGVGDKRERMLWRKGVRTWDDYRAADHVPGISSKRRTEHRRLLDELEDAWSSRDLATVAASMPAREHWRFHGSLGGRVGYLDIETTGTHRGAHTTVVGVHDATSGLTHQLLRGRDLDRDALADLLERFDLLVTFHGAGFDLPVLRNEFPAAVPDLPHLDLRTPLARLGYQGGLKRIEEDLGLRREADVLGLSGHDAVRLWRAHERRGDNGALETLLHYNAADCTQMVALAHFACSALEARLCRYWDGEAPALAWPTGVPAPRITPEVQELLDLSTQGTPRSRQATLGA